MKTLRARLAGFPGRSLCASMELPQFCATRPQRNATPDFPARDAARNCTVDRGQAFVVFWTDQSFGARAACDVRA